MKLTIELDISEFNELFNNDAENESAEPFSQYDGSESLKRIDGPLAPFDDLDCYDLIEDGRPEWVNEFFKSIGCDEED